MMSASVPRLSALFVSLVPLFCQGAVGQIDRFVPPQRGDAQVWRITHDPSVRHWASYHNQDSWSPDGRYLYYTRYEPYDSQARSGVFIYDLHEDREVRVDDGAEPRWARNHNWLFYVKRVPEAGPADGRGSHVMWLDVDTGRRVLLGYGIPHLGSTDHRDRWLYGFLRHGPDADPPGQAFRIPIRPGARRETLVGLHGAQWIANPAHPLLLSRHDHGDRMLTDRPFEATRLWCDLDGGNIAIGSPMIQRCHQSWSVDGTYHLHGDSLLAGRLWNEPFPSNLHILSTESVGDPSPVGRSGRWICGGARDGPLLLIDLWSGDGRPVLDAAASFIHEDDRFGYSYGSALEDNDAKGSPDGTKICFVSNYDLKLGPMTYTTARLAGTAERLVVEATNGFPESGRLSIGNEVIGYVGKTPTTFEDLTRRMYGTTYRQDHENQTEVVRREYRERASDDAFIQKRGVDILRKLQADGSGEIVGGTRVTSFESRLIPPDRRRPLSPTSRFAQDDFPGDPNSPLPWQNRTDVYVAVVRLPDRPHLRRVDGEVELVPGENHWETRGYNIWREGRKLTDRPLRPGTFFTAPEDGSYAASALEWSGLESRPSSLLRLQQGNRLRLRVDKPADFSWISEQWLVEDEEATAEQARSAAQAVRELRHRVDGLLHREWYQEGRIVRRYDLNPQDKAIRRLFYRDGKRARREYHHRDGWRSSIEHFDSEGYISESIQFRLTDGQPIEYGHYWYERGMPVKYVGEDVRHSAPRGPGLYMKEGERWVKQPD